MDMNDWARVTNLPKRIYRRRRGTDGEMYLASTPACQRSLPQNLCVLADEWEGNFNDSNVFLYSVQPTGSVNPAFLPSHLPIVAGELSTPSLSEALPTIGFMSDLFYCDDHLVMATGTNDRHVIATVLPVLTEASERDLLPETSAVLLVQGPEDENTGRFAEDQTGFCPMSGRLVHPAIHPSVHILDFLLPLEER